MSSSKAPTGVLTNIVGRDVVEARGGSVVRVTLAEGFSSSRLIDRVRGADRDDHRSIVVAAGRCWGRVRSCQRSAVRR
jgi:hypothetical protein